MANMNQMNPNMMDFNQMNQNMINQFNYNNFSLNQTNSNFNQANMNMINNNNFGSNQSQNINNNPCSLEKYGSILETLRNVFIKIDEVDNLINNNNNNKIELINQISLNITESQINNISSIIMNKLESIKQHLSHKENILIPSGESKIEINLKYFTKESGFYSIFGKKFVNNNKNYIDLIIKGKTLTLIDEFEFEKGENNVKMIIKNPLSDLSYMFYACKTLINIEELKYLDTSKITNFSHCFYLCSSLKDISPLQYWNVSKAESFSYMFAQCSSLKNLNPIKYWDNTCCYNYIYMFYGCTSLKDITPVKYWNLADRNETEGLFWCCNNIKKEILFKGWTSSLYKFNQMFYNVDYENLLEKTKAKLQKTNYLEIINNLNAK